MDDPSDRIAFLLDDPVRIGVARVCASAARTKSQIGHELRREPGSLTAIATLEKRGALLPAGHAENRGTRRGGKRWELAPGWVGPLQSAEAQSASRAIPAGTDLVLVPAAETLTACEALATQEIAVAWGAPLRGEQMGLLLCPSTSAGDDAAALQVLGGLGRRGVQGIRLHVSQVMAADDLREWAFSVTDGDTALIAPPA